MGYVIALFIVASIIYGIVVVLYKLYENRYFKSQEFLYIKNKISKHTKNCNELNDHIQTLKVSRLESESYGHGHGELVDQSVFNMKRKNWNSVTHSHNVHNCSLNVCKNASTNPFKYLLKYFNVESNEETLSMFENLLNNFSAVEEGKVLLQGERNNIVNSVRNSIPSLIQTYSMERCVSELGFKSIELNDVYSPVYTFQYVSAGGNSSSRCDIVMNVSNLNQFVAYLSNLIKFKKSVAGQRALMTSSLREHIKARDGYSCKMCGVGVAQEKNLLLEIDHIIPLSKGGITSEDNLQTLCWRCNRSKGAKILPAECFAVV